MYSEQSKQQSVCWGGWAQGTVPPSGNSTLNISGANYLTT
jgi:hypothetical protein